MGSLIWRDLDPVDRRDERHRGDFGVDWQWSYPFSIIDTCFKIPVRSFSSEIDHWSFPLFLIKLYKEKHLNVSTNLAAYYNYLNMAGFSTEELIVREHLPKIEEADKSLKYKEVYYPILKIRLLPIWKPRRGYPWDKMITHNTILH